MSADSASSTFVGADLPLCSARCSEKKKKGGGGNYFDLIASVPFLAAILIR
jgi:hypothetical protein